MDLLRDLLPNPALDTDPRAAELRSQMLSLAADYARLLPEPTLGSLPSWSGFPITPRGSAAGYRRELLRYLDSRHISSRLLFGGNMVRQPYMQGRTYRVAGSLATTNTILEDTFWLGVCPAVTPEMLEYIVESLAEWGAGIA